jgi:hypothetical protein
LPAKVLLLCQLLNTGAYLVHGSCDIVFRPPCLLLRDNTKVLDISEWFCLAFSSGGLGCHFQRRRVSHSL